MPALKFALVCVLSFFTVCVAQAQETVTVDLVRIPGLAGPSGSGTAVFRGDLSALSLSEVLSVQFTDSNSGVGGSAGQFSGFDLDAIAISPDLITSATDIDGLTQLNVFDFTPTGTIFNPGSQRPPVDEKLFGTDPTGMFVDADFATLDAFDSVFFTSGAVTLGDGGSIAFNLTSPLSTANNYIYVGEVSGDPGENLLGTLRVSNVAVPEPNTVVLLGGVFGFSAFRRKRCDTKAYC